MAAIKPNCQLNVLAFVKFLYTHFCICILKCFRETVGAVVSITVLLEEEIVLVESRTAFTAFGDNYFIGASFFAFLTGFTATGRAHNLVLIAAEESLGG